MLIELLVLLKHQYWYYCPPPPQQISIQARIAFASIRECEREILLRNERQTMLGSLVLIQVVPFDCLTCLVPPGCHHF